MMNPSNLNYFIQSDLKKKEIMELLEDTMPKELLPKLVNDLNLEKVIIIIETYRLRKYNEMLREFIKMEKRMEKLLKKDSLVYDMEKIDKEVDSIYRRLNLIVPIEDLLKKYGIKAQL